MIEANPKESHEEKCKHTSFGFSTQKSTHVLLLHAKYMLADETEQDLDELVVLKTHQQNLL